MEVTGYTRADKTDFESDIIAKFDKDSSELFAQSKALNIASASAVKIVEFLFSVNNKLSFVFSLYTAHPVPVGDLDPSVKNLCTLPNFSNSICIDMLLIAGLSLYSGKIIFGCVRHISNLAVKNGKPESSRSSMFETVANASARGGQFLLCQYLLV